MLLKHREFLDVTTKKNFVFNVTEIFNNTIKKISYLALKFNLKFEEKNDLAYYDQFSRLTLLAIRESRVQSLQ